MPGLGVTLGIDIGGTKTRWIVAYDGVAQTDHQVPTRVWRQSDFSERDCLRLKQLVEDTLGGAMPAGVGIGANGCGDTDSLGRCEALFRRLTGWNVRVVNDAELLAEVGGGRGISLISGTGSIAIARDHDGVLISAGGWGWLLGDDGGGAGLVRHALREALAAEDKGAPDIQLAAALKASLDIPVLLQANARLSGALSPAALARHAPVVFEAAAQGSGLARRVLDDGAASLAGLVGYLVARGASGPVFAGGGIFESHPRYFDQVSKLLRQRHGLIAFLVRDPPVLGALRLAERFMA